MHPENKIPLILKEGYAQTRYTDSLLHPRLQRIDLGELSGSRPKGSIVMQLLTPRVVYETFDPKGNGKYGSAGFVER